jgi:hypothetical protein
VEMFSIRLCVKTTAKTTTTSTNTIETSDRVNHKLRGLNLFFSLTLRVSVATVEGKEGDSSFSGRIFCQLATGCMPVVLKRERDEHGEERSEAL